MNEMEEQVISIEEIIEAIKKRWFMILAITMLATIASGLLSFFVINPTYEANTKMFIGKEESTEQVYNSNDVQMYQKLLKTYSEAIRTKDLISKSIKSSKVDVDVQAALNALTVVPVADTQILQINYKSGNPEEASKLLKAITTEFIKVAKELVPNGNVKVIEEVETPVYPVSPNKTMNIAIAFLLGLMISVGLVFLLEYLDNTYKNKEIMEKDLGLPVLGVIPNSNME